MSTKTPPPSQINTQNPSFLSTGTSSGALNGQWGNQIPNMWFRLYYLKSSLLKRCITKEVHSKTGWDQIYGLN